MNSLKVTRLGKNLSQWQLAKLSEVCQSRISLIENDLIMPTEREKKKLSEALKVNPGNLFPEEK